ncbi:MAG: sensor histidine kinase [Bryobacterales bacterium]|nr:sensor histidine kinase [Bryobacterales bacterium]
MNPRRISLLWKIWLSTSVALTAMFALMGYLVQERVQYTASRSLRDEVQSSARAYQALWEERVEALETLVRVSSGMPAALPAIESGGAGARASMAEVLRRALGRTRAHAFLLLSGARGEVVMVFPRDSAVPANVPALVEHARRYFPRQAKGFFVENSVLHQVALTPVYDAAGKLSGALMAGFPVNDAVARELKESTGRSEFIFAARGQIYASTMSDRLTGTVVRNLARQPSMLVSDGTHEYVPLSRDLEDIEGKAVGKLYILRSFEDARESIAALRRRIFFIWGAAIVIGLLVTYLAAEWIVKPVKDLDRAASEVAMQNYNCRVWVDSDDELGRLAATFNKMCESLQSARAELIRGERITTIGRLASSIVHDLRNPLAAIYGGAELLVDTKPTPEQTRRIAESIYRASRRIMDLLDDLVRVTRGKTGHEEACRLVDIVREALSAIESQARAQGVRLVVDVPARIEVVADRVRLCGVFVNLVQNALDALPGGGEVRIEATAEAAWVTAGIADTGPGIPPGIRSQLFQPFVSHGKKNGLGLGLALARQTALDHGGDLWAGPDEGRGARFFLRLPARPASAPDRDL